jgi:hypothetical protein
VYSYVILYDAYYGLLILGPLERTNSVTETGDERTSIHTRSTLTWYIYRQTQILLQTHLRKRTLQVIRYSTMFIGGRLQVHLFCGLFVDTSSNHSLLGVMIWIVGILLPRTTSTSIPEVSDLSTITLQSNAFLIISSYHMIK